MGVEFGAVAEYLTSYQKSEKWRPSMGGSKRLMEEMEEAERSIIAYYVDEGGAEACPNHSNLIDHIDDEAKANAVTRYSNEYDVSPAQALELFNNAMMNHVYDECPGCASNAAS